MFTKSYNDGTTVIIENGVIGIYDANGERITISNVDYYFNDQQGYGCRTSEAAADKYHEIFAEKETASP